MASTRAEDVAEILFELKRADKIATYSVIANRAGFSAGASGRAVLTALRTVRRDWPHLQWWRAIKDDGVLEKGSEHEAKLRESGFEVEDADTEDDETTLKLFEQQLMTWEEESSDQEPQEADS